MGTEEQAARSFLDELVKEFPGPLGAEQPLPVSPLSGAVSQAEIRGECLDLALRLLRARNAPEGLSATLSHAAVAELLKSDLSAFAQEQEQAASLMRSEPLQRCFLNKLLEVCRASQQSSEPPPAGRRFLRTSVHAIRNTRRKMEDRHVVLTHFNQLLGLEDQTERSYFAVFDGHGGVDAATYAATHLHVNLGQHEALLSDPALALKSAFIQTDDMFREKASRERLRSGSTGVAVLLAGDCLHVAWLGDSQAMLVREGQVVTLMEPHKPEREDEKRRIEDLGGCIAFMGCWRVNGTYAVSRAIGDFDQKPYVSGEPDGASFPLGGAEDYVLLACDGFFDAVQPREAAGAVLEHLRQAGGAAAGAAEQLVALARGRGSTDNITVLLVFLREPQEVLRGAGQRPDEPPAEFVFFRDDSGRDGAQ